MDRRNRIDLLFPSVRAYPCEDEIGFRFLAGAEFVVVKDRHRAYLFQGSSELTHLERHRSLSGVRVQREPDNHRLGVFALGNPNNGFEIMAEAP